ncbi:DNA-directed RNA polymerase subunit P [Candidatus Pacearchaeota archaeon]|nr:DNA-directed RNA polymerase subunit P [Candidatus Pacearchaeota archaeon]
MVSYKCFKCEKKISHNTLDKRFVCPHCGSKIFYKPRTKVKKIKAE